MGRPGKAVSLLNLLLLLLAPQARSEITDVIYHLTDTDQSYTGEPLKTLANSNLQMCALRCWIHEDCIALQVDTESCLLLHEAPSASQLTDSQGSRIYVDELFIPVASADGRIPQVCPETWSRIGNACYHVAPAPNTRAAWSEDGEFCSSSFGEFATLPTVETEQQYNYIVANIGVRAWMNIRYKEGSFKMLGGSTSTFWETKWRDSEPGSSDDGFVYFDGNSDRLIAVPERVSPMPRDRVVCMIYAGDE